MTSPTEYKIEELIQLAKQGDRDGTSRLFEAYRAYLVFRAENEVGPSLRKRLDAEDIVQGVLLSASRSMQQFQGTSESQFSAWLHQIMKRHVSNLVREHRAAVHISPAPPAGRTSQLSPDRARP